MRNDRPILLVEDNEDDVFFMKLALKEAAVCNPVVLAEDGQKAIDYFSEAQKAGNGSSIPLPVMVLLDLKLPGKKGLEVLAWLRQQPALRSLVVVVLTSSSEPTDLREAYRLGANSYLVKPTTKARLVELVRALKTYWLEFNLFDASSTAEPKD